MTARNAAALAERAFWVARRFAERVALGPQQHRGPAAGCEHRDRHERHRQVQRQVDEQQRPRHVPQEDPDQVAVAVVDLEVAVAADDRRALVHHHRIRHVHRAQSGEAGAEGDVDVLDVAEEVLVEAARRDEHLAAVERGGRRGREDLAGLQVPARGRLAMALAPRQAAHVVDVADAVEPLAAHIGEHPAAEHGVLRMTDRRLDESLEPVGRRDRVRIEQRHQSVVDLAEREVVAAREPPVDRGADHAHARMARLEPVGRAVDARVVDDDRREARIGLMPERLEAARQAVRAVEVDDDDGHPRRRGPEAHRSGGTSSARASCSVATTWVWSPSATGGAPAGL